MKFDFVVKEVSKYMVVEFTQKYHYSPVFPKITKHWLGIFYDEKLVGTMTLGWGTQPKQTIKKLFPTLDTIDYLEIGKMCMDDEMPANSESQMLSAVFKWLKKERSDVRLLYTMADGIMGKCGYVYQAANFLYGGEYWTDIYLTKTGEKVHPRSVKEILKDNAKFEGKEKLFWLTPDFMKTIGMRRIRGKMFRYMYPLNKKARKLLISAGWNTDYPKDDTLSWKEQTSKGRYDVIERPEFTFDDAVFNKKNIDQYASNSLEKFFL